ncbi:hypothetical protein LOSG293_330130 [Secundilactobacillus oryzae JCM 18671]|uniref:Uncharacterized protein n=1 Tax=Secundilactobacillus oryzae JCM 18671 TaxID=1291743 RepID=A0A081BKC7_9LACO|nr:hypothetical protein [Secundilactobacillus oryzae]GAK48495.1 hypothetical protein LOSG293_330130 [Secundilactobacillus oryzae JCM 18671]
MRKLYIDQSSLSRHEAAVVRNEKREALYLLTGKWGIESDALSVYTMRGGLLAELKQQSVGLLPIFDLYLYQKKVGSVKKPLGVLNEVLFVHGLNWFIIGNPTAGNYHIFRGVQTIMTVRSGLIVGNQQFKELTIGSSDDEPLCICLVAILDQWSHKKTPLQSPLRSHAALRTGLRPAQFHLTEHESNK